ncbi:MAG TPA: hypothetical protein VF432_04055 [Thermoanaerobaculia bacterium]
MTYRIRITVMLALLAVGAFGLLAGPPQIIEYTYYTDSSLSTPCGYRVISCSGSNTSSGCRTAWYTIDYGGECY